MNKLKLILLSLFVCITFSTYADDIKESLNPISTGVPSLTIAADARGGGMGDIGAATEPDVFSQYWNPAKYAFAYSKAGVAVAYTPWLRQLVDDIDLAYLAGYYKLGDNDNQAVAASLRYFSLGEITMTDNGGGIQGEAKPYEMAFDVSYSLKFTETFAGSAAIRYIRSDLGITDDNSDTKPGNAVAADIAGYFSNYVMLGSNECLLGLGFNASNIGTKIEYNEDNKMFLPANLRIGASLLYPMDDYNTISFNIDANKLMVPSPNYKNISDPSEKEAARQEYMNMSPITGLFKSFSDAPDGASEEFKEIAWSFGAEYAYNNQFFARGGYFYENPDKGNRQYFSLGAGFKLTSFQIDVAYLISTVPNNPLDQTLRFSLSFDMDGLAGLMR